MSDDADTRAVCPRCLRTEHSPSCLRRQEFEADKWQRRAEALASYVLGCDDSTAAGARDIVVGGFSAGYVWEPSGPRPDTVKPIGSGAIGADADLNPGASVRDRAEQFAAADDEQRAARIREMQREMATPKTWAPISAPPPVIVDVAPFLARIIAKVGHDGILGVPCGKECIRCEAEQRWKDNLCIEGYPGGRDRDPRSVDADRIRAILVEMVERTRGADDRIAILTDALRAVEGR